MKRLRIEVRGRVQGVGFRPAVYRQARRRGLRGWISNTSDGVRIEVQGPPAKVQEFLRVLELEPPPQASIKSLTSREVEPAEDEDFRILPSTGSAQALADVSPDLATCGECLRELADPADRRRGYPFLNCTNCGPRFTIVRSVPYDRPATAMASFHMCPECLAEYEDPENRRFHAQPNACAVCGPRLRLTDAAGRPVIEGDSLEIVARAAALLRDGNILAVKGIGGFHLACSAFDERAVGALRGRKYREDKPFAVMAGAAAAVRRCCRVSREEAALLESVARPIVLLERVEAAALAPSVAPRQKRLGCMLPYAPLHSLLFAGGCPEVLVMTSGNVSDEPIAHINEEALARLGGIADAFVLHDRGIETRCDDSVSRVFRGEERLLRRSRGYAPAPIRLPGTLKEPVLACGGELKSVFCLGRGSDAYLSHHIGDLKNLETLDAFERGVDHLARLLTIKPRRIACDLHPDYLSTQYAEKLCARLPDAELVKVQHHHAHVASCMADNGVSQTVIGVVFDGAGRGDDATVWGGELLAADFKGYRRAARLRTVPLPGGDAAVREVWRMGAVWLREAFGAEFLELDIDFVRKLDRDKWAVLDKMIDRNLNSPLTSSMGRLFDAVAAIIGLRREIRYEGQAAIELEAAAAGEEGAYPYALEKAEGLLVLDPVPMVRAVVEDLRRGAAPDIMSSRFHAAVADMTAAACCAVRDETGLETAALTGGVFQNALLLEWSSRRLEEAGFRVLMHRQVPPNDGGICLGQVMAAGLFAD
ncbi:MAG: carbamoyltransferase HypF [Elusimicrobiota bacterium]